MTAIDELQHILETGGAEDVKAFFAGMPAAERRALAPTCWRFHREIRKNHFIEVEPGTYAGNPRSPAAEAAVLCAGTYTELTKAALWALPGGDDAFDILADRRPEWLERWIAMLLDQERYWGHWRLVRRLIRAGLVAKPEHRNYALGMISGLLNWQDEEKTIEARLLTDPELLDDEVWRLFEHEGGGENSLANSDRFGSDGWSAAFLAFVEAGRLPRARVVASCLEALRRDFNHYRAKWFARLYDALDPTPEELAEAAPTFLALLDVSAPNIVSWALEKVDARARAKGYEPMELVRGLRPVLQQRGKGTVKRGLKLLARAAKTAPDPVRAEAATVAALALGHEDVDVQAAALDLVEALGAESGTLEPYLELVAPSLRPRLEALTGAASAEVTPPDEPLDDRDLPAELRRLYMLDALHAEAEAPTGALPAAIFDGADLPRLAGVAPLAPIEDLDALLDVAARVLEDAGEPDDAERVFDAISRLCAARPEDFERRTGPLLKRARQRMGRDFTPFSGEGPASDLCGLVHAWLTGEVASVALETEHHHPLVVVSIDGERHGQYAGNYTKTLGAQARRVHALSVRSASKVAAPLLAAPTHAGGLLDPVVLVERVNRWAGAEPPTVEVVVALLRLAPERREEALASLHEGDEEWRRAVRHALGAEAEVGRSIALWAAAARARAPWALDEAVDAAFPNRGPDVGRPAAYDIRVERDGYDRPRLRFPEAPPPGDVDPDCIPVVLHAERGDSMWELGGIGGRSEASIRWTASAWPVARESFFAAALAAIADNLDWWEARWHAKALLEPLLDPGTPLRAMGLRLLVVALAAKEPGEHGLAIDAAIAAIEDGRLGSDNLGRALAELVGTGLVLPARWAKTLAEVARASEAHAAVVKLALEPCLAALGAPPRDLAKLLELLLELSFQLQRGVAAEHRGHLEGVKGSSKLAKAARALHALPTEGDPARLQAAARQLATMRASAARRWT